MSADPSSSNTSAVTASARYRWSRLLPYVVTICILILALWLVREVWYLYVKSPWTRDAFVRAQVTEIAPEGVSGYVVELPIVENQWVEQGQLLLALDPTRYQLALEQARSELESAKARAELERAFATSRVAAGDAVSAEDRELYLTKARTAELEVARLQANLDLAQFNLDRTRIYAPASGYVTNLTLRLGNYLSPGKTAVVLIDTKSFWVEAYFQETKLSAITPGSKAVINMMAYEKPIRGTVISLARGIANANNNPGYLGLQQVNPVDAWVRLAQRIPVYIRIDEHHEDQPLAAGMTASVAVGEMAERVSDSESIPDRIMQWLTSHL